MPESVKLRPIPSHILIHALKVALRAAALGYGLRAGLDFLLKLILVAKGKSTFRTAFLHSFFASSNARFSLFFGSYAFLWKFVDNSIRKYRGVDTKTNGFIAGSIAGVALFFEPPKRRGTYAQQFIVRGLQCLYNAGKKRDYFHLPYGDSAIFILASAQIMYGYAMQPLSLPKSFFNFMLKTAPIPKKVLSLNRTLVRGLPITQDGVNVIVKPYSDAILSNGAPNVPCFVLHPKHLGCTVNSFVVLKKVFLQILPVYMALNFVPMFVLRIHAVLKNPRKMIGRGAFNAIRSSGFLGVFVSSYQAWVCVARNLVEYNILPNVDHKFLYYIYGILCSFSIFIEDKKRRSELALYVLPKGVDSLYRVLYNRKWMVRIPGFEVMMFSMGMGLIVSFYQTEHECMSTVFYRLFDRINLAIDDEEIRNQQKVESKGK